MSGKLISPELARQIKDVIRQEMLRAKNYPKTSRPYQGSGDQATYIALTGAGGIPARSTTTPGSGTVTIYEIDLSGPTLTATNYTETAYNLSGTAVGGSAYVVITQETASGQYVVVMEDCS